MLRNTLTARHRSRLAARRGASAFTLIELLLVLVILGVLAAVVVPKFTGRTLDAQIKATRTSVVALRNAINNFEIDAGRFPSTEEGLNALVVRPNDAKEWHGPYIESTDLKDTWGHPFLYQFPGQHNPNGFDISSAGPDGNAGTQDDIWPEGQAQTQ